MNHLSGLVFCSCLALGYGFFFGGSQNSLLGMGGGSGMAGLGGGAGGGGNLYSALFGMGGGAGAGMSGMGPSMRGMGASSRGAGVSSMGAGQAGVARQGSASSMDSMLLSLSRMSLCGETPSRIRYKTRGSCSPYECNRMSTGYDVACLGHSCCCKTFQCTVLLDA